MSESIVAQFAKASTTEMDSLLKNVLDDSERCRMLFCECGGTRFGVAHHLSRLFAGRMLHELSPEGGSISYGTLMAYLGSRLSKDDPPDHEKAMELYKEVLKYEFEDLTNRWYARRRIKELTEMKMKKQRR